MQDISHTQETIRQATLNQCCSPEVSFVRLIGNDPEDAKPMASF